MTDLQNQIEKVERLEYILLAIIVIDLAVKLYNDSLVKKDIEARMSKESTKEL